MPAGSLFISVHCTLVEKINIFSTPAHHCGSLEGTSSSGTALVSRFSRSKCYIMVFLLLPILLVCPKSSEASRFVLKYLKFMNKSSTQLVAWVFTFHVANKRGNKSSPPSPAVPHEFTLLTDFSIGPTANNTISKNTERLSVLHPLTSLLTKN